MRKPIPSVWAKLVCIDARPTVRVYISGLVAETSGQK
jgi:hypothetical protein